MQQVQSLLGNLRYTTFPIHGEIHSGISMIEQSQSNFEAFNARFNAYAQKVIVFVEKVNAFMGEFAVPAEYQSMRYSEMKLAALSKILPLMQMLAVDTSEMTAAEQEVWTALVADKIRQEMPDFCVPLAPELDLAKDSNLVEAVRYMVYLDTNYPGLREVLEDSSGSLYLEQNYALALQLLNDTIEAKDRLLITALDPTQSAQDAYIKQALLDLLPACDGSEPMLFVAGLEGTAVVSEVYSGKDIKYLDADFMEMATTYAVIYDSLVDKGSFHRWCEENKHLLSDLGEVARRSASDVTMIGAALSMQNQLSTQNSNPSAEEMDLDVMQGNRRSEAINKAEVNWKKPDGSPNYPPNGGAVKGSEFETTLQPGKIIERHGTVMKGSKFVTEVGTSPDALALPTETHTGAVTRYEVLKPLPKTIQGETAPWGGQPGGATQYNLSQTIEWYDRNNYITQIGG